MPSTSEGGEYVPFTTISVVSVSTGIGGELLFSESETSLESSSPTATGRQHHYICYTLK